MKKIISLSLAALMLVILLLTSTSCEVSMESMTGYTRLRDYIKTNGGEQAVIGLDAAAVNINAANVAVIVDDEGNEQVVLVGYAINSSSGVVYQAALYMTGSTEKATLQYQVLNVSTAEQVSAATTKVLLTHYTGSEILELDSVTNIPPSSELTHRQNATVLLNSLLKALDTYTTKNLDMDVHELGFIALSDKYMASGEQAEVEEDLGGAFSPERLSMAGLMIVQGMGMVFLVLAILWLVLLIFKKVFYKDPAKASKSPKEPKAAEPTLTTPAAPAASDDALVAAITAAVAAYIDSDPALSSQFAGGFRVVSFKKKNGKTSWNH